jgi:hypothetical protein
LGLGLAPSADPARANEEGTVFEETITVDGPDANICVLCKLFQKTLARSRA